MSTFIDPADTLPALTRQLERVVRGGRRDDLAPIPAPIDRHPEWVAHASRLTEERVQRAADQEALDEVTREIERLRTEIGDVDASKAKRAEYSALLRRQATLRDSVETRSTAITDLMGERRGLRSRLARSIAADVHRAYTQRIARIARLLPELVAVVDEALEVFESHPETLNDVGFVHFPDLCSRQSPLSSGRLRAFAAHARKLGIEVPLRGVK